MAKVRTNEAAKALSRMAAIEDLNGGIEKLEYLLAQVEDMSREGFPYREAVRARTELALRETLRQIFGEKSAEYQTQKSHKLRTGNRPQSLVPIIKQLLAQLEAKRTDLLVSPQDPAPSAEPPPERPEKPSSTPVRPSHAARSPSAAPSPTPKGKIPAAKGQSADSPSTAEAPATGADAGAKARLRTPDPAPVPSSPAPLNSAPRHAHSAAEEAPEPSSKTVQVEPKPSNQVSRFPSVEASAGSSEAGRMDMRTTEAAGAETAAPKRREPSPPARSEADSPIENHPEPTTAAVIRPQTIAADAPPLVDSKHPVPADELKAPALAAHAPDQARPAAASESPSPSAPPTRGAQPPPDPDDALETLRALCDRFHAVARQLRIRHEGRATLEVEDEFDVQDLLCALLHVRFGEVDSEEWCPGGGTEPRRRSYHLHHKRVTVVAKKTRAGVTSRDLMEQVKREAAHYADRVDCRLFLCFIYDPEGRIGNPRGFESDLTTVSDSFTLEVIVAPK